MPTHLHFTLALHSFKVNKKVVEVHGLWKLSLAKISVEIDRKVPGWLAHESSVYCVHSLEISSVLDFGE